MVEVNRKSTAMADSPQQYRTKISTWVVLIASTFALFLMLLFYEAMTGKSSNMTTMEILLIQMVMVTLTVKNVLKVPILIQQNHFQLA